MSRRPVVVHVINGLGSGGAEIMLLELVRRATQGRFEPVVVALRRGGDLTPAFEATGARVYALDAEPGVPSPRVVARLVRVLRAERPAVVQTWLYHANLVGGIAALLAGRYPVAWGIHHTEFSPPYMKPASLRVAKAGARLSRRLPRAIVCCADAARRINEGIGFAPERMVVIPNGFDTERFRPDPATRAAIRGELGLAPGTPLVGMLARFDPQKDHENFLRAAAIVARTHPDARFLLAGQGMSADNAPLAGWIAAAGLTDRVHLVGRRSDTPTVNAALDVAVLSSWNEAFPLVIGEAMACGTPCAVTDVGDAAIVVGDLGRIAPPKDAPALANGIAELLDLPPGARAALSAACRRRIVERYDLPKIANDYESLWLRLLSGEPVSRRTGIEPCA